MIDLPSIVISPSVRSINPGFPPQETVFCHANNMSCHKIFITKQDMAQVQVFQKNLIFTLFISYPITYNPNIKPDNG